MIQGLCLLFLALDHESLSKAASGSINVNAQANDIGSNHPRLLLLLAVFYITFGTFVMGLVVTQSLLTDLGV